MIQPLILSLERLLPLVLVVVAVAAEEEAGEVWVKRSAYETGM